MFTLFISLLAGIILLSGGFGQNQELSPGPLSPLKSMKMEQEKLVEDIKDLNVKLEFLKLNNNDSLEIDEISLLRDHLFSRQKEIAQWIEQSKTLDRLIKENQNAVNLYAIYNKVSFEKKRPQGFWTTLKNDFMSFLKKVF